LKAFSRSKCAKVNIKTVSHESNIGCAVCITITGQWLLLKGRKRLKPLNMYIMGLRLSDITADTSL